MSLKRRVVAIVGHSRGGGAALQYAAQHNNVPAVVLIGGKTDYGKCNWQTSDDFSEQEIGELKSAQGFTMWR